MFCSSCGKKITDKSKFCKHCGSSQAEIVGGKENKKTNKKNYEIVWACDFCRKEFITKKESDKHELSCPNNPKSTVYTFKFKKKTVKSFFNALSLLLGLYFFSYLVVSSYATANQKPSPNFFKPLEWFQEKKPTLIPAHTPSTIPTKEPTVTPETQTKTVTNNSVSQIECIGPDGKRFWTSLTECEKLNSSWGKPVNYMMDCRMSDYCGGGTRYLGKIECEQGACCQLRSGWEFLDNKVCKERQGEGQDSSSYKIKTPQGEEKICSAEGVSDISTYLKLMTQSLKDYNATGYESILKEGVEYEKKYYEAIARYCTP